MTDDIIIIILIFLATTVVFFYLGWYINNRFGKKSISAAEDKGREIISAAEEKAKQIIASAEERVAQLLKDAEKEANNIKREKLLEVKDEWYKKKVEFDNEYNSKRQNIQNMEKSLTSREDQIDRKIEQVRSKESEIKRIEQSVNDKQRAIRQKEEELEELEKEQNHRLEKIANLTAEEAKTMLMENMVQDARLEAQKLIRDIYEKAKSEAKKEAQKVVVQAIQRTAADYAVESTVSVLNIQSDEIKGRIIGKEGRNIRAFEAATGVDVIVDDTPEAVILSSFDPFRREVARVSLEKLITDGRIQPARIEEVVEKTRIELEEEIFKIGENTVLQLGLHGMHNELIKLIGRMKYRSSYGQNILEHSVEVAYLTGIMAAELGLDVMLAKRSGLLHDIGKVMDKEVEGPHALIGYELTKKYRENPIVCNAVGAHHDDIEMEHPIAALVQSADAISGARPGARREPIEGYAKRLETLETIAKSFEGVAKTYAIQAGREVRVVVEHERIDDVYADKLAYDIAQKIESDMEYPGQIKVTVIREVRKFAIAK
ncbi:MAG: ribonuclease Y [Ignavibacteriaceae bacterium]|nr:MAG: ribonuclease Y [Ignavibacteriaceae bacterium]